METLPMGKVLVSAKIENLDDLFRAGRDEITQDKIRNVAVSDALVDTGATTLLLPRKLIQQLGLIQFHIRPSRSVGGPVTIPMFSAVRLTVQGRQCHLDVGEINDEFPVLIGQVPLGMLDWVVDSKNRRLIGNPEHGGEQMLEVL
jgi:predicted aspartyl protease